jgi:hypothetical protein
MEALRSRLIHQQINWSPIVSEWLWTGGLYCGGSAFMVEKALGSQVGQTLYVGDHIYTDVSQSKVNLRWRTALICRELEREVFLVLEKKHSRQRTWKNLEGKEKDSRRQLWSQHEGLKVYLGKSGSSTTKCISMIACQMPTRDPLDYRNSDGWGVLWEKFVHNSCKVSMSSILC